MTDAATAVSTGDDSLPADLPGPTLAEFEAARHTVAAVIHDTPLESSHYLSTLLGVEVLLKCENLQRTGSYKIRGAFNRLSHLSESEKQRGVVAASAGNHAQGVAFAARELGIRSTIFMPIGVALPKLSATRDYGADVELTGHVFDETLKAAVQFAEETGAVFIHPFDHADIVAGQGTLGLDILDERPDVDTLIIPIGGGGLISGVASAVKQKAAQSGRVIRVIGVQAENAAPYPLSLVNGQPTEITILPTIADGIAVAKPGALNFSIVSEVVDEVVTVDEDDIAKALLVLIERAKLIVEPAGAVGIAAILAGKIRPTGTTVAILSGGNIDPLVMERIISHGLSASERYLKLRIPLPDRPGQLARTAQIVADSNANVVEVLHTRHGTGLQISQVELELHIETRGPEHADLVLYNLREAGFEPRVDF